MEGMADIRMCAGTMAAIGLTLLLGDVPASAGAQTTGEVGGPPTMRGHLPFPPPHKKTYVPKATTEPIVIGVGFNAFGKVEIVGQGLKRGLCVFVDQLNRAESHSRCGPVTVPRSIAIESESYETDRRHHGRSLSEFSGFMQPTVATVTAVAHGSKGGRRTRKTVPGIVAVPTSELLTRLHQTTAFGYFVTDFRSCVARAKISLRGFDPAGALLGSSEVPPPAKWFPKFKPCHPGSSFVGFGTTTWARAVAP
jgi:hypothetical protein